MIIFSQRTFFSIIKPVFQEKKSWNDIIVVKKPVFLNFIEKHVRLKWKKKKVNVIRIIIIEDVHECA